MRSILAVVGALAIVVVIAFFAYPQIERRYQRDMDQIRRNDAHRIADILREFADKTGRLPFQEHAADRPFMVLIGHSNVEEDHFADDPILRRGATWANGSVLEALLSKELRRTVRLPRDPQKVATFAPNVYVYFVAGNEMTVVSHLNRPAERAVEYDWNGHTFYAYTISYAFNPGG